MLDARSRRTAAVVSLAGLAVCAVLFGRFLFGWWGGRLDWWPGFRGRDVYLAAGEGYGKGFVVGFFAAFFLVLLSLAVSSWWEARRRARARGSAAAPPSFAAGDPADAGKSGTP